VGQHPFPQSVIVVTMKPLTIAFFSKQLPSESPNGVSCQVHRLANALQDRGHQVTCFSLSPPPDDARYRTHQLTCGTPSRLLRKFVPALRFRNIAADGFDIVHYHGDDYLCRGSLRRVRTFYGSALDESLHARKLSRALYQALFYGFEWISCLRRGATIGISAATRRALPLVQTVIPCGVPLRTYRPQGSRDGAPSVLFLGDLRGRKKGDLLVRTFAQRIRTALPEARLTIVGPQPCNAPGVHWVGRLSEPELIAAYRRAWVYCMPSSYEGFGVPAIEAMACGTPVVSVINKSTSEIITNEVNGLLCRADELGEALLRVLGDGDLRERLAAQALRDVQKYGIDETARSYEAVYATAVEKICTGN